MSDHSLPERAISGELEKAEKRELGREEKEGKDCVAEDRRVLSITGSWSITALDPGVRYSTVCEGGCRFMACG